MAWGGDLSSSSSSASAPFPSTAGTTTPTSPAATTTITASEPNPPAATPSMHVYLTDGHPDCVSSLHKSLALNQAQLPSGARVEVQRLVWKEEERRERRKDKTRQEYQEQEEDIDKTSHSQGCRVPFDLIVAADVVFFERFHRALLHTLHTHLNPEGGEAWLLQPSRAGSLERFIVLAKEEGGWEVVREEKRSGKRAGDDGGDHSNRLQLLKLRRVDETEGGRNRTCNR